MAIHPFRFPAAFALLAVSSLAFAQDAAPDPQSVPVPLAQRLPPVGAPNAAPTPRPAAPAVDAPADAVVAPTDDEAVPAVDAAASASVPADTAPPSADATTPTQAEQDYNVLYGGQDYNPVADPTLPPPVELPASFDPWERWNRKVHRFNNAVDKHVAKPLATAYVAVVPRPVRLGVGNFFNNLGQPVNALNSLLQGRPKQAAQTFGRFALNTTIGLVGIFDVASRAHLPNHSEDFGQTMGVWGWKRSRYVELPLFGPRTVRDVFGMVGDAPLAPIRRVEDDTTRVFLQGLQLVDVRTQLFAVDSMREGAADDYALVRDAWLQRRNYQINGDRRHEDPSLPDYLQDDDTNPGVSADAVPVPSGG